MKHTLVNFSNPLNKTKRLPLGPLYLLSTLEQKGVKTRFIDLQLEEVNLNADDIAEILDDDSEYLSISAISMMFPWIFSVTDIIKSRNSNKKIILGGPGPSSVPEAILKKVKGVDYIIQGEGESALPMLISGDHRSELSRIPNLVYKIGNKIVFNKKIRENINDLAVLDYNLMDLGRYDEISSIITSRGCPYKCSFCYTPSLWGNSSQFEENSKLFENIDNLLSRSNNNYVNFVDDLFFISKIRTQAFFTKYMNDNYSFKYQIMGTRIDSINVEILKKLQSTNCLSLWFGIESGSDKVLKGMNKKYTKKEAKLKLEMASKYIPNLVASFIVGFPDESINDFYDTLYFAEWCSTFCSEVYINLLRPQNNTPIYNKHKSDIVYLDSDLIISPKNLDSNEKKIIARDKELYSWYYTFKTSRLEEKIDRIGTLKLVFGNRPDSLEKRLVTEYAR
jgi:anaerobic magnesium-protoporphyrin IX monomethyl ester cyclase